MKKTYIFPMTEIIEIRSAEIMVPNQMSNPSFGNSYAFGEEEEEEDEWSDKLNNYNSRLWN